MFLFRFDFDPLPWSFPIAAQAVATFNWTLLGCLWGIHAMRHVFEMLPTCIDSIVISWYAGFWNAAKDWGKWRCDASSSVCAGISGGSWGLTSVVETCVVQLSPRTHGTAWSFWIASIWVPQNSGPWRERPVDHELQPWSNSNVWSWHDIMKAQVLRLPRRCLNFLKYQPQLSSSTDPTRLHWRWGQRRSWGSRPLMPQTELKRYQWKCHKTCTYVYIRIYDIYDYICVRIYEVCILSIWWIDIHCIYTENH